MAQSQEAIRIADSITKLGEEFRGCVLVAGSHGGEYCGYLTALAGLSGVILNDASVGKDEAGLGALAYLEPLGVAAATVAFDSARIGDGNDMMARGVISYCNQPARDLGCEPGVTCADGAKALLGGEPYRGTPPPYTEARAVLAHDPADVVACDSASLVVPEDAGAIIITGSHGGTLAGRPGYGLSVTATAAIFNDAGVGIDDAGIQRLAILNAQGVPAATVSASSARIGDAASAWETGVISHLNEAATDVGAMVGDSVQAFVGLFNALPSRRE